MTEQLSTYLSLLSFTANPTSIVTPLPPPVVIKAISPTNFQINPFLEKVTVNPYQTSTLNVLTQAELAIDDVVDYLSTILPTELIAEIEQLPDLANYLLQQGMSLEEAVSGIAKQLPSVSDLSSLFRAVPIMSVLQNVGQFVTAVAQAGLTLASLPLSFVINGLSFMAKITTTIVNSGLAIAEGIAAISINTVLGVAGAVISPIASLAVTLASIATLAVSTVSTVSVLAGVGIGAAYSMVALVNNISSVNWAVVGNGILLAGADIGTDIVSDAINYGIATILGTAGIIVASGFINDYGYASQVAFDIGPGNAVALYTDLQTNTLEITTLSGYLTLTTTDVSGNFVNAIFINGASTTVEIINIIGEYNISDVLSVLSQVATLGVGGYEAIDQSNQYIDLLNAITTYGLSAVENIAYAVRDLNKNPAIDFVNKANTIGSTAAQLLITIAKQTTPLTLQSSITTLNTGNQSNIYVALNYVTSVGASNVLHVVNAIKKMTATNLTTFVNTLANIELPKLLPNVTAISKLSAEQILTIGTHISNSEPYTLLAASGVSDIYLNYAVKQATESASLAGNYHMVTNLLNNYSGVISMDYRLYLVTNLLANYVNNIDDTTLGPKLASGYFTTALNLIDSNWQITNRNGQNISNHVPWITASNDALNLLEYQQGTAIPAKLQMDLNFTLNS